MEIDSNQTKFSYEKPLFEDPSSLSSEPDSDTVPVSGNKVVLWMRDHLLLTALIATGLILIVLISLALLLKPGRSLESDQLLPSTSSPTPVPLSPLEQKILEIRTELGEADPVRGMEPFPPVDLDIRLDPTQR